jgi:helix-turn-helix protein
VITPESPVSRPPSSGCHAGIQPQRPGCAGPVQHPPHRRARGGQPQLHPGCPRGRGRADQGRHALQWWWSGPRPPPRCHHPGPGQRREHLAASVLIQHAGQRGHLDAVQLIRHAACLPAVERAKLGPRAEVAARVWRRTVSTRESSAAQPGKGGAPVSIGAALAAAQRQAGLTVTRVSQQTRIRETVIGAIEHDGFSACGGDFYARAHPRHRRRSRTSGRAI